MALDGSRPRLISQGSSKPCRIRRHRASCTLELRMALPRKDAGAKGTIAKPCVLLRQYCQTLRNEIISTGLRAEFATLSDEERIGIIDALEQQSNRRQANGDCAGLRRFRSSIRAGSSMTDIDALVEKLFPVTASDMLRDLAALDFTFVVPPKARARAWKQRDVTRAFRAASRAGVAIRIEIAPDGKLILSPIPGVPSTTHSYEADDIIARLR
jgi:hypothetical protein